MNIPLEEYIIVERVNSAPYIRRRGTSDHQKHNARLLEKLNKKNKEKELRIDVMHCPEFDEAEQEN